MGDRQTGSTNTPLGWMTRPLDWAPPDLDFSVAHSARRYNYWLGGKDNFAADRESGDAIAEMFPTIWAAVRENRKFLRRAVTMLAGELGIRQFLDIGTGLPSADNTHEVAQRAAPQSRVVYVDNDPLVMVHARALLTTTPDFGITDYLEIDVREPKLILDAASRTLDFSQPIALMLVAIMHFIPDEDDPYGTVARLVEALPSGSHIVLSHATGDYVSDEVIARSAAGAAPTWLRSRDEVARFFDGLEILPPGIVSSSEWRVENDSSTRPTVEETGMHCAVARVP